MIFFNTTREYLLNERIRAKEVRVIDTDGKQLGVLPLSEAIAKAREKELDLILINAAGSPPVCKIADFGKYKYDIEKREKEAKKGGKARSLKELKLTPKIDEHDILVRIKKLKEFLEKGHKVKLTMYFRGREITHKEIGMDVVNRLVEEAKDLGAPEGSPSMLGRSLIAILSPKK